MLMIRTDFTSPATNIHPFMHTSSWEVHLFSLPSLPFHTNMSR